MSNYLVVAHQTATSPELLSKATEVAANNPEVTFTILVPATPVRHLLVWEEGETRAIARRRAAEAKELFERNGLRVAGTDIGDESPLVAIEDELRMDPGRYDGIVLSTLPEGVSRWLRLGVHTRAERKFRLPVVHVVARQEARV